MSDVTYERVISHTNESCHKLKKHTPEPHHHPSQAQSDNDESHVTYERVLSHTNEARHV